MEEAKIQELLNIVRDNYQDIAGEFDATRKKEIWPQIRKFAEKVKPGDSVLDLGCGNGRLLEALKEKETKYLGVDNSLELIKLAQNNYPKRKFIIGNILALDDNKDITDGTYDFIFCLAVLQHIPSLELRIKALKSMAKKLKDNGEIIISNWNLWAHRKYRPQLIMNYLLKIIGRNEFDFNDLVFPWKNSRGEEKSRRYYHAFTKRELRKLACSAGLKIVDLCQDKHNFWLVLKK